MHALDAMQMEWKSGSRQLHVSILGDLPPWEITAGRQSKPSHGNGWTVCFVFPWKWCPPTISVGFEGGLAVCEYFPTSVNLFLEMCVFDIGK